MATIKEWKPILVITLILGIFVFLGIYISNINGRDLLFEREEGLVTGIVDGDTIRVEGKTVRLLGIDSEEKGKRCYFLARRKLEDLIFHKKVRLEKEGRAKDMYGRDLRYVWLDGKNINIEMVREGLAKVMIMEDNVKYREELIEAQKEAEEEGKGCLWNKSIKRDFNSEVRWVKLDGEAYGPCEVEAGKEVVVEGRVEDSYKKDLFGVFLNLGGLYPQNCLTVLIRNEDLSNFPSEPHNHYYGYLVRVKGEVEEYRGNLEIEIKNSSQIEIGKPI